MSYGSGTCAVSSRSSPINEEALDYYRQSLSIDESVARAQAGNTEAQIDLAFGYMSVGVELEMLGELDEAVATYQNGVVVLEKLVALNAANLQWQRHLAFARGMIANAYRSARRPAEAAPFYRAVIAILQKLVAADARNSDWLKSLSDSYLLYGDVQYALQSRDEAVELYGKSLAARERLRTLRNTPQVRLLIAEALGKLAIGGDPIGALTRAVAIVREVKAAGQLPPGQEGWLHNLEQALAYRYAERARAHLYANRNEAAISDMLTAVQTAPYNLYVVFWLHVVRQRTGEDDSKELATNAERLDQAKWPYAVIAMFLSRIGPDELVVAAGKADSEEGRNGQLCEADFYLAMYQVEKGMLVAARQLFQSALDRCPHDFTEYTVAQQELRRLDALAAVDAKQ
jgi:tetratricopeptide (TPR) repeat protein